MKSRRLVWVVVAVAVLAAAGAAATYLDPSARIRGWVGGEPFYRGRAATAWARDLRQQDETARIGARDELAAGKGEAVSVCVWLLAKAPEPEVRWRAAEALKQMKGDATPAGDAILTALSDSDHLVRAVAGEAVEEPALQLPEGALPRLIEAFPNIGAIRAVAKYKAGGGAEAVPALTALLKNETAKVRENAARTLGRIGPPAAPSAARLIEVMAADPDPLVREHCAESLGQIGADPKAAVPALAKALKDPNDRVRRDAVRSLGQFGPAARTVLPEVQALLADESASVKKAAAAAVDAIAPGGKKK